jgi:scyllo-inositol 2-dehydrogenase (NADP+)
MNIRVGVVGYGLSGSVFHAPLIDAVEGLELAAVVSSNPEKVKKDFPGVSVVSTLTDLLKDDSLDLVVITSPNLTHFEYAKQAIQSKKHVVVEKPFTVTSDEADELIELAKQQNVLLSVYHNRRWDNDFLTVQELLKNGLLGDLVTYEAHFDRYRPAVQNRWREQNEPGSGILYDLGSHLIDQALVLFGAPRTVWADLAQQRAGAQTTDYFHLVLEYDAMRVILHSGSLVRQPGPRFQLHGSQGSFLKEGMDSQEDALRRGGRPYTPNWGEDREEWYGELTTQVGALTLKGKIKTLPGCYQAYYEGMAAAIRGEKALPVTAGEARDVIRVIECAIQSHRERRAIAFA